MFDFGKAFEIIVNAILSLFTIVFDLLTVTLPDVFTTILGKGNHALGVILSLGFGLLFTLILLILGYTLREKYIFPKINRRK